MRGEPSNDDLQKGKAKIDCLIEEATTEELIASRARHGVCIELAEYAIRRINDELAKRGVIGV